MDGFKGVLGRAGVLVYAREERDPGEFKELVRFRSVEGEGEGEGGIAFDLKDCAQLGDVFGTAAREVLLEASLNAEGECNDSARSR